MGLHWYPRSPRLLEIFRQAVALERASISSILGEQEVESLITAQERIFESEQAERRAIEERGRLVTRSDADRWPGHVSAHLDGLPDVEPSTSVLQLLGWGADYYIENLRAAGVPMGGFSMHLDRVDASPGEVLDLAEEILAFHDRARTKARPHVRQAGLWLYLWGFLGCHVQTGH